LGNRDRTLKEDRILVGEVLDGQSGAFEGLVNRYQRLVVHIVHRMILNQEEREDICQDVFVKVYRNLRRFRFEAKLSTWISRIAYNRCLNYLQKKREEPLADCLPEIESLDTLPSDTAGPDEIAASRDISSRLRAEIEQLPVIYRTILTLYHLEEMSYSEIGEITDLPEGTVKSHLFRARKHLMQRLTSKYAEEDLWS
jgi:RNA polymerase sigma-70 factor (ECF subfamily)